MNIAMRVLLAEDQAAVRQIFRRFIEDLCSVIDETGYLQEALQLCQQHTYDIIILDLVLEDSGKENTLSNIRELKRLSGASVLVVTGVPDPNIKNEALKAGADFCVPKGDEFSKTSRGILMALHAAVLKHPRPHPGDDYLAHVKMLEKLVQAA